MSRLLFNRKDQSRVGSSTPVSNNLQSSIAWPIAITIALIAGFAWYYLSLIPHGAISIYDEFYSLERSASFARQGDWWTVYSLNEPTFKKPPLQYWMVAWLFELDADLEVALRLPSMLFAILTLAATALLAAAIAPGLPWAMPAAVLLMASSLHFWYHATSAMLNVGTVFFATLAIASVILAAKRPNWYYVAAAAIVIGAFQKAPSALALVVLYFLVLWSTARWHGQSLRKTFGSKEFRRSLWISLLGVLAWPLLQAALHDYEKVLKTYDREMFGRFSPSIDASKVQAAGDLRILILWPEPVLRLIGIGSLALMPWILRRFDLVALPIMFAMFFVAMALASGSVYTHYTLIFLPMLVVSTAVVLASFRRVWLLAILAIAISVQAGGPIKPISSLPIVREEALDRRILALSEASAVAVQPDERVVVCMGNRKTRFAPGAVSFYFSNGQPITRHDSLLRRRHRFEGPYRGFCTQEDIDQMADEFEGLVVHGTYGDYLLWTAEDTKERR